MKIYENTLDLTIAAPTVVALGKFDGIHKGHMEIVKQMLQLKRRGLQTAILTFSSALPGRTASREQAKVLTTSKEKRKIFSELGIDHYVELPFDDTLMHMEAERFLREILLEKLKMRAIVCGEDCSFGYRGAGNISLLREMGKAGDFDVFVTNKVYAGEEPVSSSLIRSKLSAGKIADVNAMLMRPYLFYGEVVYGRQIGRTLGMPTVNLVPEEEKLLPPSGVYYSRVTHMGQEYRAITNIGEKPTIEGKKPKAGVESYIYGFTDEIYGDHVYVSLYEYVRPEMKFDGIDALRSKMQEDIAAGEAWHREHL